MKHFYTLILFCITILGYSQDKDEFYDTDSSVDFENDCVRGIPEPVFDKSIFPNSTFKLENSVGFETVDISDTERLILKNTGCESYINVLRFEIPLQDKKVDDVTFWYKRLVKLISLVQDGIDSPIDIKEANIKLVNYIDNYDNQPVKLGEFITISDNDIPTMMSFDNIKDIGDNRIALEISIWIGPL